METTKPGPNTFLFHGRGRGALSSPSRKYVGKIVNGVPNGLGSLTFPSGSRHVGNFWDGKPWFVTTYDKNGNILGKIVNGVKQ